VAIENSDIVKAAAELIRERAPSDDRPRVWAPAGWRELDIEHSGQLVIRLRPVGEDATVDVEVFSYASLLTSERLRKYRTADGLADLIEAVQRRAIAPDG
jgi:hypothetical protein